MGDRRSRDWSEARAAVEEGHESFREVAERLGVHHTAVSRAAKREAWVLPRIAQGCRGGSSSKRGLRLHQRRSPELRESSRAMTPPRLPRGLRSTLSAPSEVENGLRWRPGALPQEVWGPPPNEGAARLWHCRRCGLSGFDPNRRGREWHTQEVCDARLARLDRALDDSPRPVDLMTVQW